MDLQEIKTSKYYTIQTFLSFQLTNNNQTKEIYPFEFVLEIQFSIQDKELKVLHRVFNPSVENIYFCLGAHPGFNCPFEKHTSFHDYQLKFEKSESSGSNITNSLGI